MKQEGRIVIELQSPVLIRDPGINSEQAAATIRDWVTGLPYIPAGVILKAIRQVSDLLRGVSKDKGELVDRVLGNREQEGMLWLGHAYFQGISPALLAGASMNNQNLFQHDVYDGMTKMVQTWYGDKSVKARAIADGLLMEAPFQWVGEPDQAMYDCLSACCAGIRTIGEKTDDGLGCVKVMPDGVVLTKTNLKFLGG